MRNQTQIQTQVWCPEEEATHYIRDEGQWIPVRAANDEAAKNEASTGDYTDPAVFDANKDLL